MNDAEGTLTQSVTPVAASLHTITLTVQGRVPDDAQAVDLSTLTETYTIADSNPYRFYNSAGAGSYGISVTSGNPDIYLDNAIISVSSGNAINITSGNPTIHVVGDNNTAQCTSTTSTITGAGIYVAQGSTVTITGSGRNDKLTTNGAQGGAGIGGNNQSCGNIVIGNVTVYAYGSTRLAGTVYAAGIGGSGEHTCGTITIDNATVYAYGVNDGGAGNISTPGIGGGLYSIVGTIGSYGTITIRNNSSVSVQRGSSRSDYIGSAGMSYRPASSPNGIDADVDESSTVTKLN